MTVLAWLYVYALQSFAYSLIFGIAAYFLVKIWRVADPLVRFRFHLLSLVLPVVLPPLFHVATGAAAGTAFRHRIALLDTSEWAGLAIWGGLTVGHVLLAAMAFSAALFVLQELAPLARSLAAGTGQFSPVDEKEYPSLYGALSQAAAGTGGPIPALLIEPRGQSSMRTKGLRRPVIIVPSAVLEHATGAEIAAMLSHEMAHLCRRDNWASWLWLFFRGLAFYNPVSWFVSRLMWQENEKVCDDLAVRATLRPWSLASALVKSASGQGSNEAFSGAPMGLLQPDQNGLAERVKRLNDVEANVAARGWDWGKVTATGFIFSALAFMVV